MKKILHIIPNFSFGGAEIYLYDVLKNYNYKTHEIYVITIKKNVIFFENELKSIEGLNLIILDVPSLVNFFWLYSVYKNIKNIAPDIVHSHLNIALLSSILFKPLFKAKYVTTQHSVYCNTSLYYKLIIRLTNCYDFVLSNSEYTRKHLVENKYNKKSNIITYPLGIDFHRYKVDPKLRSNVLNELGISENKIILGNIGSYKFQKGHSYLIESFEKSKKINSDLHLILVGDGELKNEIIAEVNDRGLKENVTFVSSTVNVSKYFNCFDVYCSTSISESFGITLLESILFHVPIVAFDTDAIPELVQHKKTGILVKKGNTNQFAIELISLINNEILMSKIKETQKQFVNNYSINQHIKQLAEFYCSI